MFHHQRDLDPATCLPWMSILFWQKRGGAPCSPCLPMTLKRQAGMRLLRATSMASWQAGKGFSGFGKKFLPPPPYTCILIPTQRQPPSRTFTPPSAPYRSRNWLTLTRGWTKAIIIKLLVQLASPTPQSHSIIACRFHFTSL